MYNNMAPAHLCQKFLKMRTDYDTRGFSSKFQLPLPKPIIAKNLMFIGAHLPVFGKSDLNPARISLLFSIASTVQRK